MSCWILVCHKILFVLWCPDSSSEDLVRPAHGHSHQTTTDTTDSVCKSFEMLKNLYGMSVQFVEPMKKENEEKSAILIKSNKVSLKIMLGFGQLCVLYLVTISLFQHFSNNMKH